MGNLRYYTELYIQIKEIVLSHEKFHSWYENILLKRVLGHTTSWYLCVLAQNLLIMTPLRNKSTDTKKNTSRLELKSNSRFLCRK